MTIYQKEISIIVSKFKEKYSVPLIISEWDNPNYDSLLDLIAANMPKDLQSDCLDFVKKEIFKFDFLVIRELERQNLLHILLN